MNTGKKSIMSIRPGLIHPGLIEELENLAKTENRSLNNFTCNILSSHIKKIKNEQNARSIDGRPNNSQSTPV